MQSRVFKKSVSADDHGNACDILSKFSGLSKSQIKRAMNQGAVWYRGKTGKERRIRRATFEVQTGNHITLYYDEIILCRTVPQPHCIKDFTNYSIWFKPAGLMTQGTRYGDHCALTRQAQIHFKSRRQVYVVHRIDRETAGLVILLRMIARPPHASQPCFKEERSKSATVHGSAEICDVLAIMGRSTAPWTAAMPEPDSVSFDTMMEMIRV